MRRMTIAAALAAVAAGCATSPEAPYVAALEADPYYADGALRAFVARRPAILRETPRADGRRVGELEAGEAFAARYDVYDAAWKRIRFEDGESAYVFGDPLFPDEGDDRRGGAR
ncbi:MAG: SH3 domain-containing protein [Parvularculaceae bacterium]